MSPRLPVRLPHDLQSRLDIILAKPLLRRAPRLAQAIEILVRNAYERQPGMPSILVKDQQDLLDELLQIPIGNSDTGNRGYEQGDGVL